MSAPTGEQGARPRKAGGLALGTAIAVAAFALGWWCRPNAPAPAARVAERPSVGAREIRGTSSPPPSALPGAATNRIAALRDALRRAPDRATRLAHFAQGLRDLAPEDYPPLFRALRTTRGPESPEILAMLCSAWAAHDGPAAFAAGRLLAATDGFHDALHAGIVGWARKDPRGTEAALREAGLSDWRGDEMAAFMQGWASVDPAAAEAFLSAGAPREADELPAAMQRGFETIARSRIEGDAAAAMQWYAQLPPGVQARLRQAVVSQLTAKAPRLAAEWLARDESAQLGASDLTPLLRALELDTFEQQFTWARSPANAVTRESALQAIVREAAHTQIVTLGEWLAARADDGSLAPAFSAYASQVVRKSPNAAITWALSLDNPELRQHTLNTVAAEWISINPRGAREWAQRTKLVDYESISR